MRLLLVEDEPALQQHLFTQFSARGFVVDQAFDGEQAAYLVESVSYALVILDLGLPKRSGLSLLQHWRQNQVVTPIIVLTARNSWQERVEGLRAGADDYVGKPFVFEELLARAEAALRRPLHVPKAELSVAGWTLDLDSKTLSHHDGRVFKLTAGEFRLLRLLMQHPQRVFSKDQILAQLGNQDYDVHSNVVEVYIRRLRQYVGKAQIQTQRGLGYHFCAQAQLE
ncbi:MAG: response regulator transcription factor [Thiomicrospira sp.]|jgi:two-component system OmpR family response regulator|nr:response regulator transcription factor [Thiomicrospira sp.]